MYRLKLVFLMALALATAETFTQAHEIKVLASEQALPKAGERITVYLSWGHLLPVDDLIDAKAIERYELVSPSGKNQALKCEGLSLQANRVWIEEDGTYQAIVDRKVGILHHVIDAEGNRVLKRGPKTEVKEGKIESSQRSIQCGKAIIVAGNGKTLIKAVGQAIEIVPVDPQNEWRSGNDLRFQVLHHGKPLPEAALTATFIGSRPAEKWSLKASADEKGIATIRASQPGTWVLKVNARVPAVGDDLKQYDFTSYTGTLSLEIGAK